MIGVLSVYKAQPDDLAPPRVARDDVQVDVSVLVLQERIVAVVRRERRSQALGQTSHLCVELSPLLRRKRGNLLLVPSKHDDQLAQAGSG